MHRACHLTLGLATLALAATGAADMAAAQAAPAGAAPARYLNWAGRGDVAMPGAADAPVAVEASARPAARRPNRVIPHGGAYEAPPPAPIAPSEAPRRTLTPATAWLRAPAPMPAPVAAPPSAPPAPAPVQPRAVPDFLPEHGGRGQPVPAELAAPTPQPAPVALSDDPMAPRRDAPIFRLQQGAPAVQAAPAPAPSPDGQAEAPPEPRQIAVVAANPDDRPAEQGARYYSVHRQSGRAPDALTLPEPTYVDALAITAPVTIASQDLAQPDPGPTLIRDVQGRVRAQPVAPEGDYQ